LINKNFTFYQISNFIQNLNKDQNSKKLFEIHEKKLKNKISDSNKFKLLKHIGHALNGFEEIFNINDNIFNRYQEEMENLSNKLHNFGKNSDINLTNITTINIFLRISDLDLKESIDCYKEISTENLESIKVPFIEFDEKFSIVKKYSVGELKYIACNSYGILNEDYILLTKNLKWILFDVVLFEEIYQKNIQEGYIENTSRFFQMNAYITVIRFKYF